MISFYVLWAQISVTLVRSASQSGMESGWLYIGFQLAYYMLGTKFWSCSYTFLFRLKSEINIKKVQKQDLKTLKM